MLSKSVDNNSIHLSFGFLCIVPILSDVPKGTDLSSFSKPSTGQGKTSFFSNITHSSVTFQSKPHNCISSLSVRHFCQKRKTCPNTGILLLVTVGEFDSVYIPPCFNDAVKVATRSIKLTSNVSPY